MLKNIETQTKVPFKWKVLKTVNLIHEQHDRN